MIHLTRTLVRTWMHRLLHTDDTPRRTAAAFAMGVFIGFSPLFGFHTLIGIVLAFALRLNRVAALIGVYANLPWFVAPYYTVSTVLGASLLGVAPPPDFGGQLAVLFDLSMTSRAFWSGLATLLHPLLWPFSVGSMLGASVLAGVAYVLAVPAIQAGRARLHRPPARVS